MTRLRNLLLYALISAAILVAALTWDTWIAGADDRAPDPGILRESDRLTITLTVAQSRALASAMTTNWPPDHATAKAVSLELVRAIHDAAPHLVATVRIDTLKVSDLDWRKRAPKPNPERVSDIGIPGKIGGWLVEIDSGSGIQIENGWLYDPKTETFRLDSPDGPVTVKAKKGDG